MKTAINIFVLLLILFSTWALLTPTIRVGGFERRDLKLGLDLRGGTHVVLEADLTQLAPGQKPEEAMDGAMKIIERRINAFGVAEATVQRQPAGSRIVVQLPGVKDVGQTINLIGQTAQLDFRKQKLDETGQVVLDEKGEPVWVPATGTMDDKNVHLTGAFLKPNSFVELSPGTNQPVVHFEWNAEGAQLFKQITTELLNKPLGIFLDNELVSDPVVRAVIEDKGIIEGILLDEARLLAIQLNAGALPIPLKVVQQEDVDAFLGADSLKRSLQAGVVGLGLVMLFLILYYRLPGLLASLALLYYGALLLAIFKLLPVTLTLAGIAGFIVSLGMAAGAAGLLEAAATGLLAGSAGPWRNLTPIGVVVGLVAVVSYGILARASRPDSTWNALVPTAGVAALVALIGAGLAARGLAGALAHAPGASTDAAFLATSRTAVLAGLAFALAWAGGRWGRLELMWLVYPVLAVGGLKLLLEDLPQGRPVSLFVSFALYGGALFATPRLMRGFTHTRT